LYLYLRGKSSVIIMMEKTTILQKRSQDVYNESCIVEGVRERLSGRGRSHVNRIIDAADIFYKKGEKLDEGDVYRVNELLDVSRDYITERKDKIKDSDYALQLINEMKEGLGYDVGGSREAVEVGGLESEVKLVSNDEGGNGRINIDPLNECKLKNKYQMAAGALVEAAKGVAYVGLGFVGGFLARGGADKSVDEAAFDAFVKTGTPVVSVDSGLDLSTRPLGLSWAPKAYSPSEDEDEDEEIGADKYSVGSDPNDDVGVSDLEEAVVDAPVVVSEPNGLDNYVAVSEPNVDDYVVVSEPVVDSDPVVDSEPNVVGVPVVVDDYVVVNEPNMVSEPVGVSDPVVDSEPVGVSAPNMVSEPVVDSEPNGLDDYVVVSEPNSIDDEVVGVSGLEEAVSVSVVASEPNGLSGFVGPPFDPKNVVDMADDWMEMSDGGVEDEVSFVGNKRPVYYDDKFGESPDRRKAVADEKWENGDKVGGAVHRVGSGVSYVNDIVEFGVARPVLGTAGGLIEGVKRVRLIEGVLNVFGIKKPFREAKAKDSMKSDAFGHGYRAGSDVGAFLMDGTVGGDGFDGFHADVAGLQIDKGLKRLYAREANTMNGHLKLAEIAAHYLLPWHWGKNKGNNGGGESGGATWSGGSTNSGGATWTGP